MPGQYTANVAAPAGQNTTLLQPNFPIGSQGGPLPLQYPGFQFVPYGITTDVGGNVATAQVPGFYTHSVDNCIVVAAMQRNGAAWQSYYFAHTLGGQWLPDNIQRFNQWITQPQDAWLVLASPRTEMGQFGAMLNQINDAIIAVGRQPIPPNQVLMNKSYGHTYGMRLADAAIGEGPVPPVKPKKKGAWLLSIFQQVVNFAASKQSSQTVTVSMTPPSHAATATAVLAGYELEYSDSSQYGMGEVQVELQVLSTQSLSVTATLRDNTTNSREWQGSVTAQVFYFADSEDD